MKRTVLGLLVIALATLAMSGCGQVVGLVFEANLTIDNITVEEYDGSVARIRIGFENDGVWLSDVQYSVYLSDDQFIDSFVDHWVFGDSFDIGFRGYENEQVQALYFDLAGIPDGEYFIGVIVDPDDDIDESDENDNTEVALAKFTVSDGGGGGGVVLYPDGFEDNNEFWQFHPLPMGMGNWQQANLHASDDVDWFEAYQMMSYDLYIDVRIGPNGLDVPVMVKVINADDPSQEMGFAVYADGSFTHHSIHVPMTWATTESQWWRIEVHSPSGDTGEYEIQAY